MARYNAIDCIDLALERYSPADMRTEEHEEFVTAVFELAELLKDDLEMTWGDVAGFVEEARDGDEIADEEVEEDEEVTREPNPFRQRRW